MVPNAPILFAVVCPVENPALGMRINQHFSGSHFRVSGHHWLIVTGGVTAQELATKLGLADGSTGSGIVYAASGYWGRANPQVWEWIRAKLSASVNV